MYGLHGQLCKKMKKVKIKPGTNYFRERLVSDEREVNVKFSYSFELDIYNFLKLFLLLRGIKFLVFQD